MIFYLIDKTGVKLQQHYSQNRTHKGVITVLFFDIHKSTCINTLCTYVRLYNLLNIISVRKNTDAKKGKNLESEKESEGEGPKVVGNISGRRSAAGKDGERVTRVEII